jgi:hypothetical protein
MLFFLQHSSLFTVDDTKPTITATDFMVVA